MTIKIPELSLVVLVGASGSGKSTFARKHFRSTEIVSSDACRGIVSDDEGSLDATRDAFDLLHFIAGKRLARGRLTVVDATNVQREARKPLVAIAREHHCLPVAIVLDVPEQLCRERNRSRPDRDFGPHVIKNHVRDLRAAKRTLEREGFRHIFVLSTPEEIDAATITREPLWNDRRSEHGPFDVIGDVHGCFDELVALIERLGYHVEKVGDGFAITHDAGRRLVFLGDLVDRGPRTPDVLRLVMSAVEAGSALCVPGNHDVKLMRKLRGRDVRITHGLAESLEQLARDPPDLSKRVADFIDDLVSHYVLDDGKLVVAHAGLKQSMHGRGSRGVREFALYGETTGETDEYGLPVRYPWANEYRGRALVVYGHTPVPEPEWLNETVCIDTGCVFGGKLTALRYPEREIVSVTAARTYYAPSKPLVATAPSITAQHAADELLDFEDVGGKRVIETSLQHAITIREEQALAALEVMSRFAVDPRWLVYLPPTMSPAETSAREHLLEHPDEAFAHFRAHGVPSVVCQEKHMGSRAVIVVCRDVNAAKERFGVNSGESGVVTTRTGRRFFTDVEVEASVLASLRDALDRADTWRELDTTWVCLDAEIMPWSLKAEELLRRQYAATGASGEAMLADAVRALEATSSEGRDVASLLARARDRLAMVRAYSDSYRRYCWDVESIANIRVAPFHVMASERSVHIHRDHTWHMSMIDKLSSDVLVQTRRVVVDLGDPSSSDAAVRFWEELTASGGEGMVVKPMSFIARGPKGLAQPAIKCRGREYLRIIYGPEYTAPENLARLRARNVGAKRSLALRELALGVEALERFVRREPLRRVHECVFGVLALESVPVDPRL